MSNPGQFDFCPKCGAVARDGVCQSCGYTIPGVKIDAPQKSEAVLCPTENTINNLVDRVSHIQVSNNAVEEEKPLVKDDAPKTKQKSLPVILFLVAIIWLLIVVVGLKTTYSDNIEMISSASTESTESQYDYYSHIYEDYDYDGTMKDYLDDWFYSIITGEESVAEPFLYDDYDKDYYIYSDYIAENVEYKIINNAWQYYNADGWHDYLGVTYPHNLSIYCNYVTLADTGLENEDEINDLIRSYTTKAGDMYDYDKEYLESDQYYDISEYVYVTYMDENVISLLFSIDGYMAEDYSLEMEEDDENRHYWSAVIYSLNINLKTGEVMDANDVFNVDMDLINEFFDIVEKQNPDTLLKEHSKSEVCYDCKNGELIWFYTPVGVEFAYSFGYNNGYASATFNDYLKYLK